METRLLFEHLVNKLPYQFYNIAAAMYDACLSEINSYKNGFNVGQVYSLMILSLNYLKENDFVNNPQKRIVIDDVIEALPSGCSLADIDNALLELQKQKIIF